MKRNTLIIVLSLLIIFGVSNANAQTFNFLNVPVFEDGIQLKSAWAGGMNAPQWSSVDLNFDGLKDLYVFDRHGNVHLGFINEDATPGATQYRYARHWLTNFPTVYHYVLMRDYNKDGIQDMFASAFTPIFGVPGIQVFKGFYQNGLLNFDKIEFPEYEYDVIPFELNGEIINKVEVYNNSDYPAIDDIDGDGDIDILIMGPGNNQGEYKVLHYNNIALESGFTDDVLKYELADDCWGRFGLTVFSQSFSLSSNSSSCVFFRGPEIVQDRELHGGSTLCTFDADNDGDKELLAGDLIYPTIIYAKNGGNSNEAWIVEQDTMFPSFNVPVEIQDFPASYNLDVNNDGLNDLIFSPNLPLSTPDYETAWFYENTGSAQSADFNLVKKDFLTDEMLDFGTGAHPAFGDVNGDGLIDLVVGNRIEFVNTVGDANYYLVLLLNIGTATDPAYTVADRDWLDLKDAQIDARSFTPTFGDIDNDGDEDLIFGDRFGPIHFAENIAGPNMPMEFSDIQYQWKNINMGGGANSTPFIYDINKDGMSDLVIGTRSGTINYFPNIGSVGNPDFHPIPDESPNNNFFGKINTQLGGSVGFSQPIILPLNDGDYLITGTEKGWLMMYKINPDSLDSGSFELIDGQFGGLREGLISRLSFANINESNFLDVAIGNDRGGLTLFQSPISVDGLVGTLEDDIPLNPSLKIYPNPVQDYLKIELEDGFKEELNSFNIYNAFGQNVKSGILLDNQIHVAGFTPGIYLIELLQENTSLTGRFIKR